MLFGLCASGRRRRCRRRRRRRRWRWRRRGSGRRRRGRRQRSDLAFAPAVAHGRRADVDASATAASDLPARRLLAGDLGDLLDLRSFGRATEVLRDARARSRHGSRRAAGGDREGDGARERTTYQHEQGATRPSLSTSVRFASEQRASSLPVMRQSAVTARRIDASARQGLPQRSSASGRAASAAGGAGEVDGDRGAADDGVAPGTDVEALEPAAPPPPSCAWALAICACASSTLPGSLVPADSGLFAAGAPASPAAPPQPESVTKTRAIVRAIDATPADEATRDGSNRTPIIGDLRAGRGRGIR